jgi:hypothetical protein
VGDTVALGPGEGRPSRPVAALNRPLNHGPRLANPSSWPAPVGTDCENNALKPEAAPPERRQLDRPLRDVALSKAMVRGGAQGWLLVSAGRSLADAARASQMTPISWMRK